MDRVSRDGVWHVEPFFDPQTHTGRGVAMREVVEGVVGGLREGQKKHGISWRLIPCFLRHLSEEEARKTWQELLPFREYFSAVGLDSSERGNPPSKFAGVFSEVRAAGLLTVAHAGEEGSASSIREALEKLQVVRIDHGVRCLEDQAVVARLVRERIPLTVCPLSNVRLRVFDTLAQHNLPKLLAAGLRASVHSDDPAYFGGFVNENYRQAFASLPLTAADAYALLRNSLESSFQDRAEQARHVDRLDSVFTM
jgi:adenosine deaminase